MIQKRAFRSHAEEGEAQSATDHPESHPSVIAEPPVVA